MNSKIAIVLIAVLLVNIAVVVIAFSYLQNEINSLKPSAKSTPPPINSNTTPSPKPTARPLRYNYTVFEWYLKSNHINNVTWLSSITYYNTSKSWTENYFGFISGNGGNAYPEQMRDSTAAMFFLEPAFVSFDFNEDTGWTKATYKYYEYDLVPYSYTIESLKGSVINWKQYFR